MDLLKQYEILMTESDRILNLSERILAEIKGGMVEETLAPLLEEKHKVADNIKRLAQMIAQTSGRLPTHPREQGAGQTLIQIKSLLKQIRSKAESLLRIEEETQGVLKEKGISELSDA